MTWKLLLANRTFRLQHHKMKETTVFAFLRIRNDNLHTISHITELRVELLRQTLSADFF